MCYLLIAAALFLLDFYVKTWIEIKPKSEFPSDLARGQIKLCRCHNKGLAGGRLADKPNTAGVLAGISFLICLLCSLPTLLRNGSRVEKLSLALILGGAAGNLFDRLGRGYVVDYFSFPKAKVKKIRQYIYNLADLFIFLGSALLVVRGFLRTISEKS